MAKKYIGGVKTYTLEGFCGKPVARMTVEGIPNRPVYRWPCDLKGTQVWKRPDGVKGEPAVVMTPKAFQKAKEKYQDKMEILRP